MRINPGCTAGRGQHAFRDLLILSPRRHHSGIVNAQHDNFRDSSLLQLSLPLLVARDREVGSAWREGTGLTEDDHLLSSGSVQRERENLEKLGLDCIEADCIQSSKYK